VKNPARGGAPGPVSQTLPECQAPHGPIAAAAGTKAMRARLSDAKARLLSLWPFFGHDDGSFVFGRGHRAAKLTEFFAGNAKQVQVIHEP
jgi:hypothetical protein